MLELNWVCKILTVSVQNHTWFVSSTKIMRETALFSRNIYTPGTNFTRPPVVTVATNLNSGFWPPKSKKFAIWTWTKKCPKPSKQCLFEETTLQKGALMTQYHLFLAFYQRLKSLVIYYVSEWVSDTPFDCSGHYH